VDGEVGNQEENEILPLLPSQEPPPHKAVFVGDLRLADFKQLLATKGVQVLALFHVSHILSLNSFHKGKESMSQRIYQVLAYEYSNLTC
jgi:hypothetical protein